jgi:pilus assembly protein Flp/PilA
MKDRLRMLYVKLQSAMMREEGQDLVEYALLVALIGFAATATMGTVATNISGLFTKIATAVGGVTVA